MFRIPGTKLLYEDEHRVTKFRRMLEPDGKRRKRLVQFYALQGGMRTIDVDDIVDVA